MPAGVAHETAESNQTKKYGGFYIARYEAGNSSGILVSKKNTTVWNNINYTNTKIKAELMYTSAEVKSGIINGFQWDSIITWAESLNANLAINFSFCGNFKNSSTPANVTGYGILQKTGFSEYWKINNIYDLGGNANERASELSDLTAYGLGIMSNRYRLLL